MKKGWWLLLWLCCSSLWAQGVEEQIRQLHERLILGESLEIHGEPLLAKGIIPEFYEQRAYRPAWQDKDYALSVLELLRQSELEGLNPEDYHYQALTQLVQEGAAHNDHLRAQFDLLLTDGLLIYALHLRDGKVDPSSLISTWNYHSPELLPEEVIAALNRHLEERSIAAALEQLKPQVPQYAQLKQALVHFRSLAALEFMPIAAEPPLKPGDEDARVPALRQRLQELGFSIKKSDGPLYDEALEQQVQRFQQHYGLAPDGVLGRASFAALNVPYVDRIEQLRINLDRVRWVAADVGEDFVLVNIAGFELYLFRGGKEVWRTDVMTGTVNTKTPVFKSEMTYLVFNPTWTVPRGILGRSLLPKLKADPSYAQNHHFLIIDRQGQSVDPLSLDWSQFSRNYFPYTLVQQPNSHNALGQVKFMFPNAHAIYLHDTPSRYLFSRSERAFSHGCIRVKDPMEFARLLLDDEARWSRAQIDATVDSRQLQNVSLAKPIDVLLMYWTLRITPEGTVGFFNDIYRRDPEVLEALNRPLMQ